MPFNINEFISKMTKDGARPNLFEITFGEIGELFTLRAQATALPSSRIGVASAYYFGREAKFAGNRVFDNWTVEVIVDEPDYAPGSGPRSILEAWMDKLSLHVQNKRNTDRVAVAQYQKDAIIKHWNKDGTSIIGEYEMKYCFPVNIGPVNLGWNLNDQIETFTVEFAYQWWQRRGVTDAA
jgi:hypothetical protein